MMNHHCFQPHRIARLVTAIACLTSVFSLAGCGTQEPADKTKTPAQQAAASTSAHPSHPNDGIVELSTSDLVEVLAGDIEQSLHANGTLHAIRESQVRAKVAGEILSVAVREGERVTEGQELARIDGLEYRARLDDRRAALDAGRAQAELAETTRSKNENLLQKNFLSSLAYDSAKSASAVAQSQVESLQAHVTLAEKALQDTIVRAPISGWIAERAIQRGDKTSPDGHLFSIVDLSRLELEALVPANEISRVALGQTFTATVEGYAGKHFKGRVARIGAQARPGSRAISIYIEIDNPDATLKAGLFAEGIVHLDHTQARALVPLTALRSEAGIDFVYVVENSQIRRQPIETGMRSETAGQAEILKGLDAGMTVVAVNLGPLREGATVRIAAPRQAADVSSPPAR